MKRVIILACTVAGALFFIELAIPGTFDALVEFFNKIGDLLNFQWGGPAPTR
jgi:hypothetical protein